MYLQVLERINICEESARERQKRKRERASEREREYHIHKTQSTAKQRPKRRDIQIDTHFVRRFVGEFLVRPKTIAKTLA
jgi:hypothetical protein